MKSLFPLVALLIVISSCSGSKKTSSRVDTLKPTEADAQKQIQAGVITDLTTLENGYSLYSANCGKCHTLYDPAKRNLEQWNSILPKMFPKTKLSAEERANVRAYIVSKI